MMSGFRMCIYFTHAWMLNFLHVNLPPLVFVTVCALAIDFLAFLLIISDINTKN